VAGAGDVPGTKGCLNSFALLKKKYTRLRVVLSVAAEQEASPSLPWLEIQHDGNDSLKRHWAWYKNLALMVSIVSTAEQLSPE
jgi:hypothetical protein